MMQGILANEIGAQTREIALRKIREAMKQGSRNYTVENTVAEKFQPLVIRRAKTTVRQCRPEKSLVRKTVTEGIGNGLRGHALLLSGRPFVVNQQTDVPEKMNTLFIGKLDDDLAAIFRYLQLVAGELEHVDIGELVE